MSDFVAALTTALKPAIPGLKHLDQVTRLSGGASQETWSLDAITETGMEPLILRRTPGGLPRIIPEGSTGIPIETEALAIEASRAAGAKTPRVIYVLKESDGAGSGYVMNRLEGETLARKILRDKEFDAVRPRLTQQCGELLAGIHSVELTPELRKALHPTPGPVALAKLRETFDAYRYPHPVLEMAFKWLEPRMRAPKRLTLVHGDFRHGNLMIHPRDGVVAALDWEIVHIGDPVEDIGWICTNCWRFGHQEKVVGGFGDLPDLLKAYNDASGAGVTEEEAKIWIVYGSLKWGVGCMGMYQGFLRDNSVERAAIGRRSSENEIDLINLIIRGKI